MTDAVDDPVRTRAAGVLILVATPIGNLGDISARAIDVLRDVDLIVAEDTRRTRALLTHFEISGSHRLLAMPAHDEMRVARQVVERVRGGARVACVTDAGTPGISDPGERLVRACVVAGLDVEIVPGPSAAIAALVVSGFPAARFVFEGFLPRKGTERALRLAELAGETRTAVIYESPFRLHATLQDLSSACGSDRVVCVARELTKFYETVWRGTLGEATVAFVDGAKGEIVIVLAPSTRAVAEVDDAAIDAALIERLDAGASVRDATDAVVHGLGLARRRVYARAVALKRKDLAP